MSMTWCATLLALKSFETVMEGDTVEVVLDERWAHLIANDYVRLVSKWLPVDTPYESTSSRSDSSPSKPPADSSPL